MHIKCRVNYGANRVQAKFHLQPGDTIQWDAMGGVRGSREGSVTNRLRFAAARSAAALRLIVLVSSILAGTLAAVDMAAADDSDFRGPLILKEQGNFFVGGTHNANDQIVGQMYVEYWIPQNQEHPFPIILMHRGGQIGAAWSKTSDCSSPASASA